jgi:hypothetical protein
MTFEEWWQKEGQHLHLHDDKKLAAIVWYLAWGIGYESGKDAEYYNENCVGSPDPE